MTNEFLNNPLVLAGLTLLLTVLGIVLYSFPRLKKR